MANSAFVIYKAVLRAAARVGPHASAVAQYLPTGAAGAPPWPRTAAAFCASVKAVVRARAVELRRGGPGAIDDAVSDALAFIRQVRARQVRGGG